MTTSAVRAPTLTNAVEPSELAAILEKGLAVRLSASRRHRNATAIVLVGTAIACATLAGCGSGTAGTASKLPASPSLPSLTISRSAGGGSDRTSLPARSPGTGVATISPPAATQQGGRSTAAGASGPTARTSTAPAGIPQSQTQATPVAEQTTSSGPSSTVWIVIGVAVLALLAIIALVVRARRRSGRSAELQALVAETMTVVNDQVPQALASVDSRSRSLAWSPVNAELAHLTGRWNTTAENASDDDGRRAQETGRLLADLAVAVNAENNALRQGLDWTLLRPRVDEIRSSVATLTEPPAV
jgi:hypothetical protein